MGIEMATSQDFLNWVCGPELRAEYLHYVLLSEQESVRRFAHGTTHQTVYYPEAKAFHVCIPSREEQGAIVEALKALDNKLAINEKVVQSARELMRWRYAEAVGGGTETTTIAAVADVFDGPHATPKKTESGPWFLSISSLSGGRLDLEESAHISEQDFDGWTRRVTPQAGDVLFSYETRLGEAALMPSGVRACLGRRMALLRPREGQVGSRTLLQAFLSERFQATIRECTVHGATVDRIPLSELPSWPIAVPVSDPRQLEGVLSGLDDLASQKDRESAVIAELRDALLPKLISGEIRVRDAEKVVEDAI
jgi:type I restriction enzyme S subunit